MPSDLFDLHEGAERHLNVAGNLPKHLARPLLDENKRLREVLERISKVGCGIPGHSVAVGCTANQIAYEALGHPHQHRWAPEFEYFASTAPAINKWKCLICGETSVDDPRGRD